VIGKAAIHAFRHLYKNTNYEQLSFGQKSLCELFVDRPISIRDITYHVN
jgi:hypothetical protein